MTTPIDEPPRLSGSSSSALARRMLRSAHTDTAPEHSRARALAVASVLASGVAASGTASAGVLSTAALSVLKWFGAGVLAGAASVGGAELVSSPAAPAAEARTDPDAALVLAPAAKPARAQPASAPVPASSSPTASPAASFDPASPPPARAPVAGPPSTPKPALSAAAPTASLAFAPASVAPPARPSPADDFAAQLALVDRARRAVASGDSALALDLLDRLDRDHGGGRFGPEATAIRIEALVRGGNLALAETLADRFTALHPKHPLVPRVRALVSRGGTLR